ncbi:MAG: helix-turn-helix transcriptional regulator [Paludibacteraceae bacterium]|nr:helix-turn-helix transcriptional regulator [Paludibacteraceae bacterium]
MDKTVLYGDLQTPASVARELALRVKQRRIELRYTQAELAVKAGLPLATYRRFEQTGQISLAGLLQIAFALNKLSDFSSLFTTSTWANIDDMLANKNLLKRVRHD